MEEKVALFGGIGRLGIAIAEDLVKKGWKLSISYREGRKSEKTVKELIKNHGEDVVLGINASIAEEAEAEKFVKTTFKKYGRIDALINIASGFPGKEDRKRLNEGGKITEDDWKFYESNFFVVRNTSLAVLKLKNNPVNDLSIINFSDANVYDLIKSERGIDPYKKVGKDILEVTLDDVKEIGLRQLKEDDARGEWVSPYSLAKRDVGYLTWKLAYENQGGKVRVNAIAPGPILPPPDKTEDEAKEVIDKTILKRWGYEKPIVMQVNAFLENDYLTGEITAVDGGQVIYKLGNK